MILKNPTHIYFEVEWNFLMKKYMNSFIFILLFIAFSCEDVKESKVISPVPSSFTKKVLIEEFTGA